MTTKSGRLSPHRLEPQAVCQQAVEKTFSGPALRENPIICMTRISTFSLVVID
jgi:hypothetical protein